MGIVTDIRDSRSRWPLRLLTLAAVALSLMCAGLAAAWKSKADEAACWRTAYEEDEAPPPGACAP